MLSSSRRRCSLRSLAASVRDPPLPARRQPRRADPDRQRQSGAGDEHLGGGVRLRRRPLVAHDPGEERQRLGVLEHVEVDEPGAHQVRGPVPGGHQDRARRAARQQLADLGRVPGVVEQDEHPAAGQPGPVQRRPLVVVRRDLVARRRRGRAGTGRAPRPARQAARSPRAGRRRAGRRGTARGPGGPRARRAWSCPGRPRRSPRRWAPRRDCSSGSAPSSSAHSCSTGVSRPVKSPMSVGS